MPQLVQLESSELPPLVCFGAPEKFSAWRKLQERAIQVAANSPKRFVLQAAPTGFGKSSVYMGQALVTGARTIILTSTKGLQSQLMSDFSSAGLVDIRGMNSYPCDAASSEFGFFAGRRRQVMCDEGPCRAGLKCSLRDGGCEYYDAQREACTAQIVVTNYSYWMTINKFGEGLGEFDLMILDEAHDAASELADFLCVELESFEIESVLGARAPQTEDFATWQSWAMQQGLRLRDRSDTLTAKVKSQRESGGRVDHAALREISLAKKVLGKLRSLVGARGEWIYERFGKVHRFDPVWPKEYAEAHLFRGTPKVVLFSATLRPKTATTLGIAEKDFEFHEYPSSFPKARRPVIHVPTCRMNHRTTDADTRKWLARIDQIVSGRLDRKGIIHTVSFQRRNLILQNSEYRDLMMTNDSGNTRHVVEEFKRASAPAILISPSLTTGWDFPYADCHYQIVGKIPFPDTRAKVLQARIAQDKEFSSYLAMQILVQMAGRGMRAEDDYCEVLVLDDNLRWFLPRNSQFAPKWFMESVVWAKTIPQALKLGVAA